MEENRFPLTEHLDIWKGMWLSSLHEAVLRNIKNDRLMDLNWTMLFFLFLPPHLLTKGTIPDHQKTDVLYVRPP